MEKGSFRDSPCRTIGRSSKAPPTAKAPPTKSSNSFSPCLRLRGDALACSRARFSDVHLLTFLE